MFGISSAANPTDVFAAPVHFRAGSETPAREVSHSGPRHPFGRRAARPAVWGVMFVLVATACGGSSTLGPDDSERSTRIAVQPDNVELSVEDTVRLSARVVDQSGSELSGYRFTWDATDPDVAFVDDDGDVVGLARGDADITVEASRNGGGETLSGNARVAVVPEKVADVSITPASPTLQRGDSLQLTATITDENGDEMSRPAKWSTSDPAVADVDDDGTIVGTGDGEARISARASNVEDTAHVTVTSSTTTSSSAKPVVVEDFSDYESTEELLDDPNGLYIESFNEELIELDRNTGVASLGLSQSVRYDFDGVKSVMRRLDVPDRNELWIETWVKFSTNFRTDWGKDGNPDYKFVFAVTGPSRFQLKTGTFGSSYTVSSPDEIADRDVSSQEDWDGEWHRYRIHFRHESQDGACDGTVRVWIDGERELGGAGDICTNRDSGEMWALKLGANHNQMPDELIQLWWGRIAVWTENPGW